MKTKEEILEENGFDFEAFALENEYSAKNLLAAIEQYTEEQITDSNKILPDGFKVYKCCNCHDINVLKDNREIFVGTCNKCGHALWNLDVDPYIKP